MPNHCCTPETNSMCVSCNLKNTHFLKDLIYLSLERGEGKEKEGEKHQCAVAFYATQARALTGSQTSNPLIHRPSLSLLSYTGQGKKISKFLKKTIKRMKTQHIEYLKSQI